MGKGNANNTKILITTLGFIMIGVGSYFARFNVDEKVSILGGIIVSIGVGLLAFARVL